MRAKLRWKHRSAYLAVLVDNKPTQRIAWSSSNSKVSKQCWVRYSKTRIVHWYQRWLIRKEMGRRRRVARVEPRFGPGFHGVEISILSCLGLFFISVQGHASPFVLQSGIQFSRVNWFSGWGKDRYQLRCRPRKYCDTANLYRAV